MIPTSSSLNDFPRSSHALVGMLLCCLFAPACSGSQQATAESPQAPAAASSLAGTSAQPAAGSTSAGRSVGMGGGGGAVSQPMAAGAGRSAAVGGAGGRSDTGAAAGRLAAGSGGGPGVGGMSGIAGTQAVGGATGATGAAGATPASPMGDCQKGAVKASEVVFIGESFIAATNAIPRMTSQLAREAGTIGMNESYRTFAVSGTQLTTGDIPNQYMRAKAASPVKVVLMDGGGNDLLIGNRCKGGFDASCKEIVDVVSTLFKTFKGDGVRDVVYFFYPDPMGIGAQIKSAMDILRPEMKKLCDGASEVRCIWVDQRETWEGNYDKFTSDGIHPTDAGSMASATQIWSAMVQHCVAQ